MLKDKFNEAENQIAYKKISNEKSSNAGKVLALLFFGFCYYVWIRMTGLCIPCIFRLITGLKCPGCGITTMIMRLSMLNFRGAFIANPFLFITAPFLAFELIYAYIKKEKSEKLPRWNTILLYLYLALLLIFGIVRNIINI